MRRPLAAAASLLALAAVVAFAVVAAAARADDGLRPGETVRETDALFPGAVPEDDDGLPTMWVVRIVDAWTGRAIPGATVRVPNHVGGAATPEDVFDLCAGTTDADGWARLPWKPAMGWRDYIVADAPGYAPNEDCPLGSTSCELTPGTDVPIVLLDFTGRPVAGARVAMNLGCGHIPDQRECVTDAQGRAVLRSIDPQVANGNGSCLWIESPRVHRGTAILTAVWRPGNPPVPVYGSPGIVVAGKVVGTDGKPLAGARVGASDLDRPWVHTGADGRFRLSGVEAWHRIDVYASDEDEEPTTWFHAPPEGVERTLDLRAPTSGVPVTVSVRGPAGEPAEGVRVAFVRKTDGLTAPRETDAAGAGEFSLPPGRYDVLVDGELGTWGRTRGTADVAEGKPATLSFTVPRNPTVRVDASRVKGLKVSLSTARQFRMLDPDEIDGRDVPVPAGERSVFRVWGRESGELLLSFVEVPPPGPAREHPLVLAWEPVTHVTARLVGPDGAPAAGRLKIERLRGAAWSRGDSERPEPSAAPAADTRLAGTADWTIEPADKGLAPAYGTVTIAAPGKPVDLGEVRLAAAAAGAAPAFRIEFPQDLPTEGGMAHVSLGRVNYVFMGVVPASRTLPVDLPPIGRGECVNVSVEGGALVPLVLRIDGPPPWVARWPDTSLRVRAEDETGAPIEGASVILGDPVVTCETDASGALLRGIPTGVHEVVVAAAGRRAKVLRLTLAESDPREIAVRLAPSAPEATPPK